MLVGRVPSRGAVLAFPSECEISGLAASRSASSTRVERSVHLPSGRRKDACQKGLPGRLCIDAIMLLKIMLMSAYVNRG